MLALRKKPKPSSCCVSDDLQEATRRAVLCAVHEGALSKAAHLLLHPGRALGEVLPALRALHPTAPPPLRAVGVLTDWEAEEFKVDEIEKALNSFPPGSSAGLSGLVPAHVPRGNSGEEQRLLGSVASFCSALAFQRLPETLCDYVCAARLIALEKPGSTSVRPIAVIMSEASKIRSQDEPLQMSIPEPLSASLVDIPFVPHGGKI